MGEALPWPSSLCLIGSSHSLGGRGGGIPGPVNKETEAPGPTAVLAGSGAGAQVWLSPGPSLPGPGPHISSSGSLPPLL